MRAVVMRVREAHVDIEGKTVGRTAGGFLVLLGVAPADCTLYEDAPANCAAAKSVGMTVVGVYDPFYENYQDQVRENSHRYLRSFTELLM